MWVPNSSVRVLIAPSVLIPIPALFPVVCLTTSLIPEASLLWFGWSFHSFSQCCCWDVALRKSADHRHWVVHKIHLPQAFSAHREPESPVLQLSPTQGRSPKMTLIFPLPHWDLLLWVGMVAPEVICKFPSHYCSLRWIFPCEGTGCETSPELFSHPGLAPEAMSRVTARSLTHRGVKHGMPGSSSDLLLEEKVLFSTFSFWHDCTPLSSSYSSWTLNSLQNSLANHKIPFFLPPCFTLLCY